MDLQQAANGKGMTLRRMWIISALVAALMTGMFEICALEANWGVGGCLILSPGGVLALMLTASLRLMVDHGQNQVVNITIEFFGNWVLLAILCLIWAGLRRVARRFCRSLDLPIENKLH